MRIETNLPGLPLETIEAVGQDLGSRLPNGLREAWLHDNKFEVGEWFFYPIKDEHFFNKTWEDYQLIELLLDLFVAGWLPNMADDGLLCGLDWSSDLKGMEYDPETVREAIEDTE